MVVLGRCIGLIFPSDQQMGNNKRMKTQLVLDALAMAYGRRKPSAGLLHHSDRGSQYAFRQYRDQLENYQMIPSMSRKNNCWDNATTEQLKTLLQFAHGLKLHRSRKGGN